MNEVEFKSKWNSSPDWLKLHLHMVAKTMVNPVTIREHMGAMQLARYEAYKHGMEAVQLYIELVNALENQYILEYVYSYDINQLTA